MESFNPHITNVASLDHESIVVMDYNQILQEAEIEVNNDSLIFNFSKRGTPSTVTEMEAAAYPYIGSDITKIKPVLEVDSNKSNEMDVELIDGGKINSVSKLFNTVMVDPSGCQNSVGNLAPDGSSSHAFDILQENSLILVVNETDHNTAIREKNYFPSTESGGCNTVKTTSTDSKISLEPVDFSTKASHSEIRPEEHQQCSLCLKWSTSESWFKRHILWHFFLKNNFDSNSQRIKIYSSVLNNKSLEELIRSYELIVHHSSDILCWNCHRNYEIHFTASPVNSKSDSQECPICLNTFNCKIRLQIHRKVHLSRSPYACCICKLDFKNARLLITHMNTHKKLGVFSNVCDTSHNIYSSRSADKRNLKTGHDPKGKRDPSVADHHLGRVACSSRNHEHSGDVCETSLCIHSSANDDESNIEIAQNLKGKEDLSMTNHDFQSENNVSDARAENDSVLSNLPKNYKDGKEVASCSSAHELAQKINSCMKVDRFMNKALDYVHDDDTAMTMVFRNLECCINMVKGMREISQPLSDQTSSILEDLSELEAVLKTVMLTSYGSILADLDRSQFWCKICATPFQESAKFQIHKVKFCTGNKNRELNQCRNETRKQFQYKCTMCDRHFFNPLKRYDHMVFHFALKLQRCPVCTKHFKSPSQFTDHLLTHPLMENNLIQCPDCNKFFCDERTVARHFKRAHTVQKPYKCEKCSKEFLKGSSFALHIKSHLRNKWRKSLVGMDMYKAPKQSVKIKINEF